MHTHNERKAPLRDALGTFLKATGEPTPPFTSESDVGIGLTAVALLQPHNEE